MGQNKLHFDDPNKVYLNAEESIPLDGGRNFAMFQRKQDLMALTWVDPVTVVTVGTKDKPINPKGKKSTIHGTNGMLVPTFNNTELLGIAHFHRPEDRKTSDYARHGHHYTHAFYTI